MTKTPNTRRYDLEDRTFEFARSIRSFVSALPRTLSNCEDVRQLVRASGSVAANYIEANEALGKKDFLIRIKISRKEAKESQLWLRLLNAGEKPELEQQRTALIQEASELTKILSAILNKSAGEF